MTLITRVMANDTFCLYLGWTLVVIGFLVVIIGAKHPELRDCGFAFIGLGIASQLMSFQDQVKVKK